MYLTSQGRPGTGTRISHSRGGTARRNPRPAQGTQLSNWTSPVPHGGGRNPVSTNRRAGFYQCGGFSCRNRSSFESSVSPQARAESCSGLLGKTLGNLRCADLACGGCGLPVAGFSSPGSDFLLTAGLAAPHS